MQTETLDMHLYSRKVLIKNKCSELMPNYLRFVKGVVDCEDLPLNISRENYQDSSLMLKLRNVLTRRTLKMLEDEAKKDPERYNKWYQEFQNFLLEGMTVDQENSEPLLKLMRFHANFAGTKNIAIEEYIAKMAPTQEKIYFLVSNSIDAALQSPFYEPFKGSEVPVMILTNNIYEVVLTQVGSFKGKKFVNIETSYDEISKDLGKSDTSSVQSRLPEDEVTPFCLWLKNELQPSISKVTLSRRLKDTPAIVVGQMSSSMRVMMQMMNQQSGDGGGMPNEQAFKDQTLEINPAHPIIVNLNHLRKQDVKLASIVSKQVLDSVLLQAGIPFDTQKSTQRTFNLMEKMLDAELDQAEGGKAQRKIREDR